ncbi:DNA replication initiation factor cdc45 [Chamberlinius hualienensis]
MFIQDLRKEFYDLIIGRRILVMVGLDVDALCACKIIQHLMQCDHVVYSLIPVSGAQDIITTYMEYSEQVKHFLLINCGGSVNLMEELNPDDDALIFIVDSHRPIDVFNIYSRQIRLLMSLEEGENVPSLEDVYKENENESDENMSEEDDDENEGRRRLNEDAIERRIEKRRWTENRHRIMFDYMQFSYYGNSSAMIMFDLAWKMSKDTNDLLWWSSIGLTDQLIHHRINQTDYALQAGNLQNHVARLNHRNENDQTLSVHSMKIYFDNDLQLALYRHWSLYESLRRTPYTACKFRLWTQKGEKRLYEFLAELGIPLAQCKQRFSSMDMDFRNNVKTWIEEKVDKYGLDQLFNGVFVSQFGFKHRFSASDFVHASTAILESGGGGKRTNFLDALDCLSRSNIDLIGRGLDLAKCRLTDIFVQVQTLLSLNQVISAGAFLYAVISKGSPGSNLYSQPLNLSSFCYTILQAHIAASRNSKCRDLPLVVSAPSVDEDKSIIIGIPPLSENSSKNFFGQAFQQASKSCGGCSNYYTVLKQMFVTKCQAATGQDKMSEVDVDIEQI